MIRFMLTFFFLIFLGQTSGFGEELFDTRAADEQFNSGLKSYFEKAYEEAIQEFEEAIRFNPGNANAYYFIGYSYYQLNQMDRAVAAFDQAYEINSNYTPISSHGMIGTP